MLKSFYFFSYYFSSPKKILFFLQSFFFYIFYTWDIYFYFSCVFLSYFSFSFLHLFLFLIYFTHLSLEHHYFSCSLCFSLSFSIIGNEACIHISLYIYIYKAWRSHNFHMKSKVFFFWILPKNASYIYSLNNIKVSRGRKEYNVKLNGKWDSPKS